MAQTPLANVPNLLVVSKRKVELLVGQVGDGPEQNEMFHILYDGSVADEKGYMGMGGRSEELTEALHGAYRDGLALAEAVQVALMNNRQLQAVYAPATVAPSSTGIGADGSSGGWGTTSSPPS